MLINCWCWKSEWLALKSAQCGLFCAHVHECVCVWRLCESFEPGQVLWCVSWVRLEDVMEWYGLIGSILVLSNVYTLIPAQNLENTHWWVCKCLDSMIQIHAEHPGRWTRGAGWQDTKQLQTKTYQYCPCHPARTKKDEQISLESRIQEDLKDYSDNTCRRAYSFIMLHINAYHVLVQELVHSFVGCQTCITGGGSSSKVLRRAYCHAMSSHHCKVPQHFHQNQ